MITIEQLDFCRNEALRFLYAVGDTKTHLMNLRLKPHESTIGGNKHTAAVRRASMDLTRALAELRRYRR